jgi:prepilin-type N-terminal cleavage/methylation domain-containing protein
MRGYSLLEVLVATTIVVVGVAALAQLIAFATHTSLRARETTTAAILAQQKMEELLPQATTELTPSPADALARNVDGYSDFVESSGHTLGGGPAPPPGSAYLRRWSMDPLPDSRTNTWILQVVVADLRGLVLARVVTTRAGHAF